jgi:hypothetical protein
MPRLIKTIKDRISIGLVPSTHRHIFTIEEETNCIEIKTTANRMVWLQMLVWDKSDRLVIQCLHWLTTESYFSIDVNNPTANSQGFGPGEYKIDIMGVATDTRDTVEVDFVTEIISNNKSSKEIAEEKVSYSIWADENKGNGELLLSNYDYEKSLSDEARWYKGDFHTHTNLSDGVHPQHELLKLAEKAGLDFIAATDHNIVPIRWADDKVLVIPGVEITDRRSHFNLVGIKQWVDFRKTSKDGGLGTEDGTNRMIKEGKEKGAITCINHPAQPPTYWHFEDTKLEDVIALEIINSASTPEHEIENKNALLMLDFLWNDGYRIWGIGGSDVHDSFKGYPSVVGDPINFVFSENLSAKGIIDGVKKGNVYVSRGQEIDLRILCHGKSYMPGDDLTPLFENNSNEIKITYNIKISGMHEKCRLQLIENGVCTSELNVKNGQEYSLNSVWKGKDLQWSRLQLVNEKEDLILFTNPVYKGSKEHTVFNWKEMCEQLRDSFLDEYYLL